MLNAHPCVYRSHSVVGFWSEGSTYVGTAPLF